LGQFGKIRAKILQHPRKFRCSYTYAPHHHRFRDFQGVFGTVLGIFGVLFVRALTENCPAITNATSFASTVLDLKVD